MVKMLVFLITCIAVSLIFSSCARMRDYTGVRNGSFGLDIQKGFGQGGEKKDYYVTEDGVSFVVRDKKSEIIAKLGFPDSKETTVEGYECWEYKNRKLKLFFQDDYLKDWVKQ